MKELLHEMLGFLGFMLVCAVVVGVTNLFQRFVLGETDE
jgi:hypothetical protein